MLKENEDSCCPSLATLPPLKPPVLPPTESMSDDYCYICGSADVKMTNPNFQPFALFNGDIQSSATCVELEEEYNQNRSPGTSCAITLTTLTSLLYAPSACGCVGFEPPNSCQFCVGRNVNREIIIPDIGITCGVGFDLLQHAQSAVCQLRDLNLDRVEEVCCPASARQNTNFGGTADESSASISSRIPMGLLLCVLTAFFSV